MASATKQSNVELVEELYGYFADGNVEAMMAGWTEDIEWVAVAGAPYGGTYHGPSAVGENVLTPLATDWSVFSLEDKEFIDAGNRVVVTGTIRATGADSGEDVEAAFAHVVTVTDGKVTRFVEYADTYLMHEAL